MAAPVGRPRVCYFYDNEIGSYYYGAMHPMKPHRLRLTHTLCMSYGLLRKMEVFRPHAADAQELMQFHSEDYVGFLQNLSNEGDNADKLCEELSKYSVGPVGDCPAFDGLYEFSQYSAGGSIDAAIRLNHGLSDTAINWAGGLHHAKKSEASGFCYVNDIVLGILELLKYHARVLYIDIDIHHGDGVEEAFYTTDRVMTVSFHRFGGFFPGTGDVKDIGVGAGKNYSVNVPFMAGLDDRGLKSVFEPVIDNVMRSYRPNAVVLQCGADSVCGDKIGDFNVTVRGHGDCVSFVKSFGLPTMVLGGGGYNIRNVARAWTYETALLLNEGANISGNIPYNEYFQYFGPDFKLFTTHPNAEHVENRNTTAHLDSVREKIAEQLRQVAAAPSVQMHQVPGDMHLLVSKEEMHSNRPPEVRITREMSDAMVERGDEFFAGDKDNHGR